MRFDDFTRATRSHTFPAPTDNTATILAAAQTVLVSVRPLIAEAGLTLIGVTLANLDHADAIQLELPFRSALLVDLDHAMDRIRDRFGTAALTRAALVGRDSGLTVPLLPD
jgi:DNA polymerase-4